MKISEALKFLEAYGESEKNRCDTGRLGQVLKLVSCLELEGVSWVRGARTRRWRCSRFSSPKPVRGRRGLRNPLAWPSSFRLTLTEV